MSIPFSSEEFRKLCFVPYNTIFVSFLAHMGKIGDMRMEQEAECEHRTERLRANPNLNQAEWSDFNTWIDGAEKELIRQIEAHLAAGTLVMAKNESDLEIVGWCLCRMEVSPMGNLHVGRRMPVWKKEPNGSRSLTIQTATRSSGVGLV